MLAVKLLYLHQYSTPPLSCVQYGTLLVYPFNLAHAKYNNYDLNWPYKYNDLQEVGCS